MNAHTSPKNTPASAGSMMERLARLENNVEVLLQANQSPSNQSNQAPASAGSLMERLTRLEHNMEVLIESCQSMARGLDAHHTVLDVLCDTPVQVQTALKELATHQHNINLGVAVQFDQVRSLITDLQDDDVSVALQFETIRNTTQLEQGATPDEDAAGDSGDTVRFDGDMMIVAFPDAPDTLEEFTSIDAFLSEVIESTKDAFLITDATAANLYMVLAGGIPPELAFEVFGNFYDEMLVDTLRHWGDSTENVGPLVVVSPNSNNIVCLVLTVAAMAGQRVLLATLGEMLGEMRG